MANHRKTNQLGISAFCESLAMMIKAGIQVNEAVYLLGQKEEDSGVLASALRDMGKSVDEGSSLAEAMKKTELFPEYALRMIEAGESTGKLEEVLFRLASYYREQNTISEKLRSVIIYPAAMLVMIIIVLVIMLKMVLPSFADVYNSLTGSLSESSYRYISLAFGFCRAALVVMVLLVVIGVGGLLLWNGKGREKVEKLLASNSACRGIMETLAMYRFTSAFEVFLASGEMQDEAMLNSLPMAEYGPVEEKLKGCARKMEEGIGFAKAANEMNLYEPIYGRMLIPGERSGHLDAALRRLIELLGEDCVNRIDRLINFVEPVLSGVLMITIGAALLSVMLPLIGIMNSIG